MCVTIAPSCLARFTASRLNSSLNALLILGMFASSAHRVIDVSGKPGKPNPKWSVELMLLAAAWMIAVAGNS